MWATYNLNSNSHFGLGGEAWSMSSLLHVQPGNVTETMVLFAFLRRERYCHLNDSSKRHQAKASWTKTDWTEITSSPLHEVSDIDQGKESEHIPSFNDAYQLIKEYWAGARGVSSLVLYSLGQFISSSMISSSAFMSESKVFLIPTRGARKFSIFSCSKGSKIANAHRNVSYKYNQDSRFKVQPQNVLSRCGCVGRGLPSFSMKGAPHDLWS